MEKVLVNKKQLEQAQKQYNKLKKLCLVQKVLLVICFIVIGLLGLKPDNSIKAQPTIVGHGDLEQIGPNMYEIVDEPIELEEIKLPPMPTIK